MTELAQYDEGPVRVVVSHEGAGPEADLVFRSYFDDNGRTIVEENRIPTADFLAKGEGPWPWFDLGAKRAGALHVLDALGVERPAWTEPLAPDALDLFERAYRGDTGVIELLAMGADPDPVDPCGATPLWYAVRSMASGIVVALIDAGADPGRRIELSARGARFTTILHEIVRLGRTVALSHALANGTDPAVVDSGGAMPIHVLDGGADNINPEIVRALVKAGVPVDAALPSGTQPIELAALRVLPATVAALVELGADPRRGLDALMKWWAINAQLCTHRASDVADIIDILRAGGAEVTDRHRDVAATAGPAQVENALRR